MQLSLTLAARPRRDRIAGKRQHRSDAMPWHPGVLAADKAAAKSVLSDMPCARQGMSSVGWKRVRCSVRTVLPGCSAVLRIYVSNATPYGVYGLTVVQW